jgi:hypothetical protein
MSHTHPEEIMPIACAEKFDFIVSNDQNAWLIAPLSEDPISSS